VGVPGSAGVYARISSDVTGEGLGVKRQLEDCRKLAADRGWVVAEEYVDNDISAFSGKTRPAYERMLADIQDGHRDGVIVYNLDRLTRQPIELEQFSQVCERAGVKQMATVTTDINLGNDDGLFTARILAAVAAKESARKSARQKRKARQDAEAGKPGGGNTRPFGYNDDKITVRKSEAKIIRTIMARFLAGESLRSIAIWLNEKHAPTVTGLEWKTTTLKGMLTSGRIAGLRTHHGEVVADAIWPGIITPLERQQVLAMFESKKVSGRRAPRRYLLSGLLRCGRCGNKLYTAARVKTRRYICITGPDHGGCGKLTIVAAPVEQWITEAILLRLDTPAMTTAITGRVALDDHQGALFTSLQEDQVQLKELASLWAQKVITSTEWATARTSIQGRIHTAERQLAHLTGNSALEGFVGKGRELRARWEALNLERQTVIVGAVLDYATIRPGTPGSRSLDPRRIALTWRR